MDKEPASTDPFANFSIFSRRVHVNCIVNVGISNSRHPGTPALAALAYDIDNKWAENLR